MGARLYLLRIYLHGILWDWGVGSKKQKGVYQPEIPRGGPLAAGGGEGYRIFRKNTDRPASIGEESPG